MLTTVWDMPPGFGFNMGFTARFDQAAVVFDLNTGKPFTVFKPDGKDETPQMSPNDGYYNEIEYFLGCIERDEDPTISTPAESRDAVAVALAEKESAQTGKPVTIS